MTIHAPVLARRCAVPVTVLLLTGACAPASRPSEAPAPRAEDATTAALRLLPGAVAGSALGVAAGAGAGRWVHENTACCFARADYFGLPESLLLAATVGTVSSATTAWLTAPPRRRPGFWRLMGGAAVGGVAGAVAAASLSGAIAAASPDHPFLGLAVVFTLAQGTTTAAIGAAADP